jgi:ABC-type phosphate transport system substrate-binding protein
MRNTILTVMAVLLSAGLGLCASPQLNEKNYPKVDGSTSTQALQALIKSRILGSDHPVAHSDTGSAYSNLMNRAVDLIIVARPPSKDETVAAEAKGVKLDARPMALDALVFVVNKDNPVKNLNTNQIISVFSGHTRQWEDLGIPESPRGRILAHTRARFSGSEELMRSLVMKDRPMRLSAHESEDGRVVIGPMGMSISTIADEKLSLTYSIYYYVKYVKRLVEAKEKSLEDLRRRQAAKLKLLDESEIRQKDKNYWVQLRKREEQVFLREEEEIMKRLDDTRKALAALDKVKMIKVDGIEPNPVTVASREYPYTAEVYVVVRDDDPKSNPAHLLRDWLLTSEGKKVIAESGYVVPGKSISESAPTAPAATKDISVDNVAHATGNKQWNWTIFLTGSRRDLDKVESVEYTLHPTFRDPVRRVSVLGDSDRPFGLSATGWGTFEVGVRVFMKDGGRKDLKHRLKF